MTAQGKLKLQVGRHSVYRIYPSSYFCMFFRSFLHFTDDDSVIIGSWFEEPATPGDENGEGGSSSSSTTSSSHANSQTKTPQRQNSEMTTLVPEKGEPHGVSIHISSMYTSKLNNNVKLFER